MTSGTVARCAPISLSTRAVSSTGVPTGMSSTTWNSLLLSKGSIFMTTSCTTGSATEAPMSANTASHSIRRLRAAAAGIEHRRHHARKRPSSRFVILSSPPCWWASTFFNIFCASQGVTTKATTSEMNMPTEALIGMGRMYGPSAR